MGGQPEQAWWALADHPGQAAAAHRAGPFLAGDGECGPTRAGLQGPGSGVSPAAAPSPSRDGPGVPFSSWQLLCLIGEMFDEYSDEVCGAVINIRAKGDKIAIWTREAENREGVTHIG